jgi:UDP-glucose 4-epimerase
MASVLVTGAAGFIGSHTCEQLVAMGHRVVGVDNFRTGRRENLSALAGHGSFQLVSADVTDPVALDQAILAARPDAIIHLAALVSVPESIANPEENFRLNVRAPAVVAEAVRRHRVPRLVFASSAAVYGDTKVQPLREDCECRPLSPYGGAKLASEALLLSAARTYGFSTLCLRYFNVFGPRQDPKSPYSGVISIFADKMKRGEIPTIFGSGEQSRDFISVGDVARANAAAATVPKIESGALNICTGRATTLNKLATTLHALLPGSSLPSRAAQRPGDIEHSVGAPDRARARLGFSATISLETGLAGLLASS